MKRITNVEEFLSSTRKERLEWLQEFPQLTGTIWKNRKTGQTCTILASDEENLELDHTYKIIANNKWNFICKYIPTFEKLGEETEKLFLTHKKCKQCGVVKDKDCFHITRKTSTKVYLMKICKSCRAISDKKTRKEMSNDITDRYIKGVLKTSGFDLKNINVELLTLKRLQLQLKRKIYETDKKRYHGE